jgi:hypothetical protein
MGYRTIGAHGLGAHGFHLRGGWGYNSHRRRPACPLPTPKVVSGQAHDVARLRRGWVSTAKDFKQ